MFKQLKLEKIRILGNYPPKHKRKPKNTTRKIPLVEKKNN
jgi:hypothetical protein